MALIYNGKSIPNTGVIQYNATNLTKVIYNGVTVWTKMTYATSLSGTHKFNIYNQAWDRKTDTAHITFSKKFQNPPNVSATFTYSDMIVGYDIYNITVSGFDVDVTHPKGGDPRPYVIEMTWTARAK